MALPLPTIDSTGCCSATPVVGAQSQSSANEALTRIRSLEIRLAAAEACINALKLQAVVCVDVDFAAETFSYTTFAGTVTNG